MSEIRHFVAFGISAECPVRDSRTSRQHSGHPQLYSTVFHGETQRLRDPLRLSTGDKRDAHTGFDQKVVTTPAVLQQRD
jgi:hypothetical protein